MLSDITWSIDGVKAWRNNGLDLVLKRDLLYYTYDLDLLLEDNTSSGISTFTFGM